MEKAGDGFGNEREKDTGRWVFNRRLGAGAFGVVELWRNDYTEATIAIKKCKSGGDKLSPKRRERWIKEVETMNSLRHPNIVGTRRVPGQLRELDGSVPILCMEYCSRGDLRTLLNESTNCCGIEEDEALKIMRHVSSAVEYLHSQNLTHRDLKPENVVWQKTSGTTVYKLTDFGYVRELGEISLDASVVGTLNYLAPELLLEQRYTCSVDYWSLGILFYEILTGIRPFLPNMPITIIWMNHIKGKRDEDICARDERGKVTFGKEIESPSTVSECMRPVLTAWFRIALQWDPKKRGKCATPDGEQLVVFSMLKNILSWKVLRVFVVPAYRIDSYGVHPKISVQGVRNEIARKSGIDVTNQILTDRMGTVLKETDVPFLHCTKDSFLMVFRRDSLRVDDLPPPHTYPPILRMIDKPRFELDNETARRYYAAAFFFVKQKCDLFRSYVLALSIKIDLSNAELEGLREVIENLTTMTNSLMGEITAYAQSPEYGLTSAELREALDTILTKTRTLLDGMQELSSKLDVLSKDIDRLKTFSEINWLEKWTLLYEKAKFILEKNARETRGQRSSPVLMAKLLLEVLELHHNQLRDSDERSIDTFVRDITNCDKNMTQLRGSVNSFEALVDLYRKNYEEILAKRAIEEQSSCYALIESMTLDDAVIYDNIVLRRMVDCASQHFFRIDELCEETPSHPMDVDDLDC